MAAFAVGFWTTEAEASSVQPLASVVVTEYAPATFTLILSTVAPVLQRYVRPPEAVSVVVCPGQISRSPEIVATGAAFNTTVAEAVAVHPFWPVTVTV